MGKKCCELSLYVPQYIQALVPTCLVYYFTNGNKCKLNFLAVFAAFYIIWNVCNENNLYKQLEHFSVAVWHSDVRKKV